METLVHGFRLHGQNIVLDVYSGTVHVLDDVAFNMIEALKEITPDISQLDQVCTNGVFELLKAKYDYSNDVIEEAYREIYQLYKDDMLFTKDTYRAIAKAWDKKSAVKALCLHVAHDCNLRCKYCFASTGTFHGERSIMSEEIGRAAIDFLIKNSQGRKNLEVDFFGGEPLMAMDTVKSVVAYADREALKYGKNFRFTITTNGILIDDEIKAYINEHMDNVVLSIDGRKEVNDSLRGKTYDIIVPKFKDLADSRNQERYYVRGTFTSNNLDFANDVLHLADLGFLQTSIEPVVAEDGEEHALKNEHLPKIYEQYEFLAKEYVNRKINGNGFNFFHFMIDLEQGPCVAKRLSGCGAGHEYVAVTPDGDIYPCHQFVGNEEFKMGSVLDGTFDDELKGYFANSHIYTKDACQDCFAKFYCSGGCPSNAFNFNGDINKPYEMGCYMQRKRIECALYIAAALS